MEIEFDSWDARDVLLNGLNIIIVPISLVVFGEAHIKFVIGPLHKALLLFPDSEPLCLATATIDSIDSVGHA